MNDMNTTDIINEYKEIKADYAYNPDIMSNEDDRIAKLKYIIDTKLAPEDKTILLLYAELGSYRKLGERFGVSHTMMRRVLQRIIGKVTEELDKMNVRRKDVSVSELAPIRTHKIGKIAQLSIVIAYKMGAGEDIDRYKLRWLAKHYNASISSAYLAKRMVNETRMVSISTPH